MFIVLCVSACVCEYLHFLYSFPYILILCMKVFFKYVLPSGVINHNNIPSNGNKNTWIRENTITVLLNSITYNFCVISYRTQRKICKVVTKNITAFIYMVTLTVITWKLSDNSGQCANLYASKLHTYTFSSIHTVTVTFGSNKVCDTWQKNIKNNNTYVFDTIKPSVTINCRNVQWCL